MARPNYRRISQKIAIHNTAATGKATTSPRAKLRRASEDRLRESSGSVSGSFTTIALSILNLNLVPRAWFHQSADNFFRRSASSRSQKRGKVRRLFDDWRDLAMVLRILFGRDVRRSEKLGRIIALGSGRDPVKRPGIVLRLAIALACLLSSRVAMAQDEKVITPIEMFDDASKPGLRLSPGLVIHPQAVAQIGYDSNIYNVDAPKRSDGLGILLPSFLLETDLPRHRLELAGNAEVRRYFKTTDENSEQYELAGRGLLELGGHIDISGELGLARRIEMRGTAGDQFATDRPVNYLEKRALLRVSRMGPAFGLTLEGSLVKRDFKDASIGGVPIDLSYRDATVRSGVAKASYRVSPKISLNVQLDGNQVRYEEPGTISRNSSGFAVLGGIRYQLTSLIDLEADMGYLKQNFDNPLVGSVSGFNYLLIANWTPTPRWRFTASGQRVVDASPLSNVPAIVQSNFKLKAQRAVSDRVLLEAEGIYIQENYRVIDRTDRRYLAEAAIHYRVTDRIGAIARAGYRKQDGGTLGRSYEGFAGSLSLKVVL